MPYEKSAEIYDLLYTGIGLKDYPAEVAGLEALIQSTSPHAKSLLDVACGTGAHLAELRHRYQVEGADLSPAMLAVARRRLDGVPLHQADMRTLDLGRTFDVVLCLFSSIAYMTEAGGMRRAVGRIAAHVAPGGLMVLDGWVRPNAWRSDRRADPEVARDENTTVVRVAFSRRTGDITDLEMHHLVQTGEGVDYFLETHRLALVPTAEYVEAVEAAGLKATVIPDYLPNRDRVVGVRA